MTYSILMTKTANRDIASIISFISEECYAPQAAVRLYKGIREKIYWLQDWADIYAKAENKSLFIYGDSVYRINYKGFAIIYTIENSTVIIHRIIHGSLIT